MLQILCPLFLQPAMRSLRGRDARRRPNAPRERAAGAGCPDPGIRSPNGGLMCGRTGARRAPCPSERRHRRNEIGEKQIALLSAHARLEPCPICEHVPPIGSPVRLDDQGAVGRTVHTGRPLSPAAAARGRNRRAKRPNLAADAPRQPLYIKASTREYDRGGRRRTGADRPHLVDGIGGRLRHCIRHPSCHPGSHGKSGS